MEKLHESATEINEFNRFGYHLPGMEIWTYALQITREIETWLEKDRGRRIVLKLKPHDQARLLRLRVWSQRYKVEIRQILDWIVPIIRSQITHRVRSHGLGVTIGSLTSNGAEQLLQEEIRKRYPNGEHIYEWRERERERQLEVERREQEELPQTERTRGLLRFETAEEFITAYRERIRKKREEYSKTINSKVRKRKPYRGNPWI